MAGFANDAAGCCGPGVDVIGRGGGDSDDTHALPLTASALLSYHLPPEGSTIIREPSIVHVFSFCRLFFFLAFCKSYRTMRRLTSVEKEVTHQDTMSLVSLSGFVFFCWD